MKYSYSKITSYTTCPLQYDLRYVKWIKTPKKYKYDTVKGIIFHKYAEVYNGSNHRQALSAAFSPSEQILGSWLDLITVKKKQEITNACNVFKKFYDETLHIFEPYLREESFTYDEGLTTFNGVLDFHAIAPGGVHTIMDYKTPQTANTEWYKKQLSFYSYVIAKKNNITFDKIKTAIFFPFAGGREDVTLSEKTIISEVDSMKVTIAEIESPERKTHPIINRMCSYCDFALTSHCPESKKAGII